MSTAIDPSLIARFGEALERLNPGGGRIGLAVSGGPDSMALLLLAHETIPGGFDVATVDHGLRAEAKDECALVAAACAQRGVPCDVLRVELGKGNLQAMARLARYDALDAWAARRDLSAIATAHHADDQAETLLMRLNRGSGVAGLAGVRERSEGYSRGVIRPLLDFRRADLADLIQRAGIPVAHDPSNDDERYDRVRMRKALGVANWIDPVALARSALHLAEADEALDIVANQHWLDHAQVGRQSVRIAVHPARAIRLRLIERAMRLLGGHPRGGEIARLDDALRIGSQANLAGVMVGLEKGAGDAVLTFSPEPERLTG